MYIRARKQSLSLLLLILLKSKKELTYSRVVFLQMRVVRLICVDSDECLKRHMYGRSVVLSALMYMLTEGGMVCLSRRDFGDFLW